MSVDPEQQLIRILREQKISHVATLPCDKMKGFLSLVGRNFHEIPLTREADGVGICAGLVLAGRRPVMAIQNTGLGNAITDIVSLTQVYQLPLPILVSWRGVYKEPIEVQKNLGEKTPRMLDALGIPFTIVETQADLGQVSSTIEDIYQRSTPHAILLSPRLWENSRRSPSLNEIRLGSPEDKIHKVIGLNYRREPKSPQLDRYEATKLIMEKVSDQIVIGNIGIPSKEVFSIRDRPLNFYMLGSLGLATSIGVGLSLGQEREVWVLDGDGALLMNPNALFSLSMFGTQNLTIFAIDNASWGSTGSQVTPTLDHIDLELLAKSCGVGNTHKVHCASELHDALQFKGAGPKFIHFVTKPGNADVPTIPLSTLEIKERFLNALWANDLAPKS